MGILDIALIVIYSLLAVEIIGLVLFMKWNKITASFALSRIRRASKCLELNSASIEKFLAEHKRAGDEELEEAKEFLKSLTRLMDESHWMINTSKAMFRTINKTGGDLMSVRAHCRLYVDDRMFHSFEIAKTNISNNKQIKAVERIQYKVGAAIGTFRAQFGALFGGTNTHEFSAEFYDYTICISDSHKMAKNNYIRELVNMDPIEPVLLPAEEFEKNAASLPDELKKKAELILETIASMKKIDPKKTMIQDKAESFTERYLPVVTRAIKNYNMHPDESKRKELDHTLDIVAKATDNLYEKLSSSEEEMASLEQDILEQQLIREGLYSPFDNQVKRG